MPTRAPRIRARPTIYKNIKMRSVLESRWAEWFDFQSLLWKFEPKTFKMGGVGYKPDFLLLPPVPDHWVEVKPFDPKKIEILKAAWLSAVSHPVLVCCAPPGDGAHIFLYEKGYLKRDFRGTVALLAYLRPLEAT